MASRRMRIKTAAKLPGAVAPLDRPKTPSVMASSSNSVMMTNFTENSCSSSSSSIAPSPSPATLPPPSPLVFHTPSTPKPQNALPIAHKSLPQDEREKSPKKIRQRPLKGALPDAKDRTMRHYAFYNPPKDKDVEKPEEDNGPPESPKEPAPVASRKTSTESISSSASEQQPAAIGPRVKVGKDGKLILDEQSLVVETSESQRAKQQLEQMETVSGAKYIVGSSGIYSRKKGVKRGSDWDQKETMKFYRGLMACGTDFSMMATMFKGARSRGELKAKYKREDRRNPQQVSRALSNQYFDPVAAISESEDSDDAEGKSVETSSSKESLFPSVPADVEPEPISTEKLFRAFPRTGRPPKQQLPFQKPGGKLDWEVYKALKSDVAT